MNQFIAKMFDELESHIGDEIMYDYEDRIVQAIENESDKESYITLIYSFMEKYPLVDWGMPGEFVNFLESFSNEVEEEYLLASISRQPTMHTVWMINRLINASDIDTKQRYLQILCKIANDDTVAKEISDSAQDFLNYAKRPAVSSSSNNSMELLTHLLDNLGSDGKQSLTKALNEAASEPGNLKKSQQSSNLLNTILDSLKNFD